MPIISESKEKATLNPYFKSYIDARLRYESDWDSRKQNGTFRDDRQRLRTRLRAGLRYEPSPYLRLETRLRTGATRSQQSPHLTLVDFSGASTGKDKRILLDKWYVEGMDNERWVWVGRNKFPFWKQTELFWDDDVTPIGGAIGMSRQLPRGAVGAITAYLRLPDGAIDFHNQLLAGQLIYSADIPTAQIRLAGGFFHFNGKSAATNFRGNNGSRDYSIWVGNLQFKADVLNLPMSIGVDFMLNAKRYARTDPDIFTRTNRDQKTGYVLSFLVGTLEDQHNWLAGYRFAHVETLAVNASFAQDDWIRFGSETQTDSSDFEGHEIRLGYCLFENINILSRLYLVEALTTAQNGKRWRLDFNVTF